ncbi:alpha-ketoglutarate-dependent dioxygenase AlkB [Actinomycetospora sp. TBRC 11914]|uniref:alpha-ketoglutarate-dependent dioxygenase AlkB n=1 Tax=Actinomycetospora sp. TBRC 11914 TaxID=2729387 RepID=UPI00145E1AA2|nr:alpha-ketoglutarate-dependent dioxygenase AlkB [Actinomycetospora sp. TBRC 11914]NMO92309.1 alpha-ketoglutarate-dependent dioxygenase AlkB [Actinomycetospora sp. TBRC 11914]
MSVPIPRQDSLLDLLDDGEPAVDEAFADAERVELDETSWLEHVHGWLRGSRRVLDDVLALAPFEQRSRWMYSRKVVEPRLTAEYPDVDDAPLPVLRTVAAALTAHYGVPYRSLWINLYRDHHDSTSWHGDTVGKVQETSTVPVLSLGATRRFLIKPAAGGRSTSLAVESGDLIVMGGRAQRDWRHAVPKQATPAGPRISINFAPGEAG